MASAWINHVLKVKKEHNCDFKEALKRAKKTYKKQSEHKEKKHHKTKHHKKRRGTRKGMVRKTARRAYKK